MKFKFEKYSLAKKVLVTSLVAFPLLVAEISLAQGDVKFDGGRSEELLNDFSASLVKLRNSIVEDLKTNRELLPQKVKDNFDKVVYALRSRIECGTVYGVFRLDGEVENDPRKVGTQAITDQEGRWENKITKIDITTWHPPFMNTCRQKELFLHEHFVALELEDSLDMSLSKKLRPYMNGCDEAKEVQKNKADQKRLALIDKFDELFSSTGFKVGFIQKLTDQYNKNEAIENRFIEQIYPEIDAFFNELVTRQNEGQNSNWEVDEISIQVLGEHYVKIDGELEQRVVKNFSNGEWTKRNAEVDATQFRLVKNTRWTPDFRRASGLYTDVVYEYLADDYFYQVLFNIDDDEASINSSQRRIDYTVSLIDNSNLQDVKTVTFTSFQYLPFGVSIRPKIFIDKDVSVKARTDASPEDPLGLAQSNTKFERKIKLEVRADLVGIDAFASSRLEFKNEESRDSVMFKSDFSKKFLENPENHSSFGKTDAKTIPYQTWIEIDVVNNTSN